MAHHAAYNLDSERLDVVIVEDSKPMQTVLRSILMPLRLNRTRVFDSADEALQAMINEPPNLVITDWRMQPTSGYQLLRAMRYKHLAPLCYVPVIFVTAHATRPLVEKALRAGAHHLLAKPLSPARLHECIAWVLRDARELTPDDTGSVRIEGVVEAFDAQHKKRQMTNRARAFHQHMEERAGKLQSEIDDILSMPMPVEETETVEGELEVADRANDPVKNSLDLISRTVKTGEFAEVRRDVFEI